MQISNFKEFKITPQYWKEQKKKYLNPKQKNRGFLLPARLEFKPLLAGDLNRKPKVIAIDTETYAKNGNLICLANSENNDILNGTVDKQPTIEEYFNYLGRLTKVKGNVCFFVYNLKFDASILLKTLDIGLEKFYEDEFSMTTESGIKIKYLNKKCLSFSKGNTTINIFDALQYFIGAGENGGSSLDSVAKAYLGEQKEYLGKYQNKVFPDIIEIEELRLIIEYCIKDCILTAQLMNIWIDAFFNNFGFYPNKFYSAGFVSVLVMRTKLNQFYTFGNSPFIVQQLAYKSYFGGRFEIMEKGFMKDIYHYDIKSAYPHAMAELPDFNHGRWFRIKSKEDFINKAKNEVGFYKIIVDVKEKHVAPFLFRGINGEVLPPRGKFMTHTTGYELSKALDYYDFDLLGIEGFYFKPQIKEKTEFNNLIQDMYKTRMKQKNAGQKYVYKVIINSIYGKTAQAKPTPKGLFSPILCASITGHCRAKLLDVAKDNKNDIVMFATDGIFSKKKLNLDIGNELGQFDFEFHPKFILLMAGIYSYNTVLKPDLTPKSRGFSLKTFFTENGEKKSRQFDFNEYGIIEKDGNYYYEIVNIRPLSIAKSLIEHAHEPKEIGKMIDVVKKIDLNGDKKRIWFNEIKSIYDHSESITAKLI